MRKIIAIIFMSIILVNTHILAIEDNIEEELNKRRN